MPAIQRARAARPIRQWLQAQNHQAHERYLHTQFPLRSNTAHPKPPRRTKPSFLKRHYSRIVSSWIGLLVGSMVGLTAVQILAPPPLPAPGTEQDRERMAELQRRIDAEFKVSVLRGKCLGVTKQLKGEEGGWVEVVGVPALVSPETKGAKGEEEQKGATGESLLDLLQGARGLGVERVFWNRGVDKELVAIVWFGGSLCGWPQNAHGGVIATAMTEKLALAALLARDGGEPADVLAAATPQRLPGTGNHAKMLHPAVPAPEPTGLSLSYIKPTRAEHFFVVRVTPSLDLDEDKGHLIPLEETGPAFDATMETLDGTICVKARATFAQGPASSKGAATSSVKAAKESYEDFKAWLWPSRQKSSQLGGKGSG